MSASGGSRAICVRCGAERSTWAQICPACGHRPDEEGQLVAWLLSSEHLTEPELDAVRGRILAGEVIRPSGKMLGRAKRALGRDFTTDAGLTGGQRLLLLATSLVVTPLVGWVLFVWWYNARPRSAVQALALSLPATVAFTLFVLYLR
ncbi:MAG: hypothetical protein ABMA64_11575 [Myxococcota bacterium]